MEHPSSRFTDRLEGLKLFRHAQTPAMQLPADMMSQAYRQHHECGYLTAHLDPAYGQLDNTDHGSCPVRGTWRTDRRPRREVRSDRFDQRGLRRRTSGIQE